MNASVAIQILPNVTAREEKRAAVDAVCMEHLLSLITILNPHTLVGVGAYATQKLRDAASRLPGKSFTIGTLLHPSPASPIAT